MRKTGSTRKTSAPKIRTTEVTDLKGLKKAIAQGGGTFLQRVPEDGIVVRFLTEPGDRWVPYQEHYDQVLKYFPCVEDRCVGCADDLNRSKKTAIPALVVDTGQVRVFALGTTLVEKLIRKAERHGTITDRDYELLRSGTGLQTDYDLEELRPKRVNLDRYPVPDVIKALQDQLPGANQSTEDDDDEEDMYDDEDEPPTTRRVARKPTPRKTETVLVRKSKLRR